MRPARRAFTPTGGIPAVRAGVVASSLLLALPALGEAQLASAAGSAALHARVLPPAFLDAPESIASAFHSASHRASGPSDGRAGVATLVPGVALPTRGSALADGRVRTTGAAGFRGSDFEVAGIELEDGTRQYDLTRQSGEALVAIRIWVSADARNPVEQEPAEQPATIGPAEGR